MHPDPDRTLMRCCGKLVPVEYEEHGYAVCAVWRCVLCGAERSHGIGEIDATRARPDASRGFPVPARLAAMAKGE